MADENYQDRVKVFDTYYNIINSRKEIPSIKKYKKNDEFSFKNKDEKEFTLEEAIKILEEEANK